jgi:hypothetical protein
MVSPIGVDLDEGHRETGGGRDVAPMPVPIGPAPATKRSFTRNSLPGGFALRRVRAYGEPDTELGGIAA